MKNLFLKLFLKDKFIGQMARAAASVAAGYLVTLIGGLPELLKPFIAIALQLPEGTQLSPENLTAVITTFLTTLFLAILNAVIERMLAKDANLVLGDLKASGLYDGPLDGWAGPVARQAVNSAIDTRPDGIQDFR